MVKIKAITHRNKPTYQSLLGTGKEQSELLAIPTEASIFKVIKENLQIDIQNAYYSSAGGGQLLLILQIKKHSERDDVRVKQAGLMALSTFYMLKHVILIDEDVNIYSHEDIMWAMTTRFQADSDIIVILNQPGFPADPSQSPKYSNKISTQGFTSKAVFDCTVPRVVEVVEGSGLYSCKREDDVLIFLYGKAVEDRVRWGVISYNLKGK